VDCDDPLAGVDDDFRRYCALELDGAGPFGSCESLLGTGSAETGLGRIGALPGVGGVVDVGGGELPQAPAATTSASDIATHVTARSVRLMMAAPSQGRSGGASSVAFD
jgi:hypothetical protein